MTPWAPAMASPELTINLSVKSQLYKLSGGSPESLSGYIVAVHSAGNGGRGQLASGNGASTAGIGFQRGLAAVASRWLPRSFLCSFQRAGAGRLEILVPPRRWRTWWWWTSRRRTRQRWTRCGRPTCWGRTRTWCMRRAGASRPCIRHGWTPSPFLARPLVVLRHWPVLAVVGCLLRVRWVCD
jgi:hypothetical protein